MKFKIFKTGGGFDGFLKKSWPKVIFSIASSQVDNSQLSGILSFQNVILLNLETIRVSFFRIMHLGEPPKPLPHLNIRKISSAIDIILLL